MRDPPIVKFELEVANHGAANIKGSRRPQRAFSAPAVRRCEDLFGWEIDDVAKTVRGLFVSGDPHSAGQQTNREVGPRPSIAQSIEGSWRQRVRGPLQPCDVL